MATHRYRGHEFAITRDGRWSYYCHSGVKMPRDPEKEAAGYYFFDEEGEWELLPLCREDGWGSRSYDACVRKVQKSIDRRIRENVEERKSRWPAGLVNR